MNKLRIAFAGDRDIGVSVLRFILDQGEQPLALLVPPKEKASHAVELIELCQFLEPGRVFFGSEFRQTSGLSLLRALKLDYIICVHFPFVIPASILSMPSYGVLNLHPAYLPYNRGWHTPSWAIIEETPYGATLHAMDSGIDTGDIIHQKRLEIFPNDTAHTVYHRIKRLELEVFKEAWSQLMSKSCERQAQNLEEGSFHNRSELFSEKVRHIDLDEFVRTGDLIKRLRALTTNRLDESAYFVVDDKRYGVQVLIREESGQKK